MTTEQSRPKSPRLRAALDLALGGVLAAGVLLNADLITGVPDQALAGGPPPPDCAAPCGCPDGLPADCCGGLQYCSDGSICEDGGGGPVGP